MVTMVDAFSNQQNAKTQAWRGIEWSDQGVKVAILDVIRAAKSPFCMELELLSGHSFRLSSVGI
jgi:hypothetical protein